MRTEDGHHNIGGKIKRVWLTQWESGLTHAGEGAKDKYKCVINKVLQLVEKMWHKIYLGLIK